MELLMHEGSKNSVGKLDSLSLSSEFNTASTTEKGLIHFKIEYEHLIEAILSQEKIRVLHLADTDHYNFGVQYLLNSPLAIQLMAENGFEKFFIEQHPNDVQNSYAVLDNFKVQSELINEEIEFFYRNYWSVDEEDKRTIISEFYNGSSSTEEIGDQEKHINRLMVDLANELGLLKAREHGIEVLGLDCNTNKEKSTKHSYQDRIERFGYDEVITSKLDSVLALSESKVVLSYGSHHQFEPKSSGNAPNTVQRLEIFSSERDYHQNYVDWQILNLRLLDKDGVPKFWNEFNNKTCIGRYYAKEQVFILDEDAPSELKEKLIQITNSTKYCKNPKTEDTIIHKP